MQLEDLPPSSPMWVVVRKLWYLSMWSSHGAAPHMACRRQSDSRERALDGSHMPFITSSWGWHVTPYSVIYWSRRPPWYRVERTLRRCEQQEAGIIGGRPGAWLPHLLKVLFIGTSQFLETQLLILSFKLAGNT